MTMYQQHKLFTAEWDERMITYRELEEAGSRIFHNIIQAFTFPWLTALPKYIISWIASTGTVLSIQHNVIKMYKITYNVRSKVLLVVTRNGTILWNIIACTLIVVNQNFWVTYCLHTHCEIERDASKQNEPCIEESDMDTGWNQSPEKMNRNKEKSELVVALKGPVFIPREWLGNGAQDL
jgi:hypothetical protein